MKLVVSFLGKVIEKYLVYWFEDREVKKFGLWMEKDYMKEMLILCYIEIWIYICIVYFYRN